MASSGISSAFATSATQPGEAGSARGAGKGRTLSQEPLLNIVQNRCARTAPFDDTTSSAGQFEQDFPCNAG
jgi:hypothetical protein